MLSIPLRYIGLFVVASGLLLSGQSTISAEDRFGDSGKNAASRRDNGTSGDRDRVARRAIPAVEPTRVDVTVGVTLEGRTAGRAPGGRDSGKDGRGGTDRDGSDREAVTETDRPAPCPSSL